ncbi:hypothetical protein K502DRAFT_353165 [Neoconidiobolus thromboides FSU 785]|nr:hypothetical protein K502DRAFT_353165 [Neoconidiobolus thromboides FSU 785]
MEFEVLIPIMASISCFNAASSDYYGGYNPCKPRTVTSTSKITETSTITVVSRPTDCPTTYHSSTRTTPYYTSNSTSTPHITTDTTTPYSSTTRTRPYYTSTTKTKICY